MCLQLLMGHKKMLWDQTQDEINFARENVKATMCIEKPAIKKLWDLIFGPQNDMGCLLEKKTKLKCEDLHKVLGTFFPLVAYNLTKNQLFRKNSFVNTAGLCDENTSFWHCLARMGSHEPGNGVYKRGLRPLWMEVQIAFNKTCRKLFIEGFTPYMHIINDDDKCTVKWIIRLTHRDWKKCSL